MKNRIATNTDNELRTKAEGLIKKTDSINTEFIEQMSSDEINSIFHELKVYQIELEMQNDELRITQSELEHLKARYFSIYDLAPEGYLILSDKGTIIETNLTAAIMLGVSKCSLINRTISDFVFNEDQDIYYTFRKRLHDSMTPQECEVRLKRNDHSIFWGHLKSNVVNEFEQLTYRLVISDINTRKVTEEKLLYLSTHDHLTGLYNRRYFEKMLKEMDTFDNMPLSVIMFDVNGLKLVNDSFGHELGDVLLNKAAETLKKVCRNDDVVARIGGDEFVLLLPNTTINETVKIANQIKELTSKEIVANIELSISYGYDTKASEQDTISEIVLNAENHMYKHKLFERTSIRSKTIELIMSTLFEKSKCESEHANRVSHICQAIATKMELNQNTINQMRVVGLMHDIGKIGVDEKILNKAGVLDSNERIDIERHPEIGWRLLSSTNEFSDLAQFVIHHHEKWDGSGYPNGLKGESIQIEARIIAVAEAYDAMTSYRSFEKKLTVEEATNELSLCSGTQFDPDVVNALMDLIITDNWSV